jgi:hypothetical protein
LNFEGVALVIFHDLLFAAKSIVALFISSLRRVGVHLTEPVLRVERSGIPEERHC